MKKLLIIIAATLGILVNTITTQAQNISPNDVFTSRVWCDDINDVHELFAEAFMVGDVDTYVTLMMDVDFECFDTRLVFNPTNDPNIFVPSINMLFVEIIETADILPSGIALAPNGETRMNLWRINFIDRLGIVDAQDRYMWFFDPTSIGEDRA